MAVHKLKTWPEFFNQVLAGRKTGELRKDDRGFEADDVIYLEEWDPETEEYTGRWVRFLATSVLKGGQFGLKKGYCLISFHYDLIQTSKSCLV